jgi:hypothetical protein
MKAFALGAASAAIIAAGLVFAGIATSVLQLAPAERCLLGYPNSDNPMVFELTGKGAWDVCDSQTNAIRQINALQGTQVLAANTWAPRKLCQFDQYGLVWTIWWTNVGLNPSVPYCTGGV